MVAYFDEAQPRPGPKPKPKPGRADITAEWNGATWAFATEENRDRFLADPEAYAPAYDGHCDFSVAKGGKVPGDPQLWRVFDGRLDLNLQPSVQEIWLEEAPGNIAAAEASRPGIENDPASDRPVPELATGTAPITN